MPLSENRTLIIADNLLARAGLAALLADQPEIDVIGQTAPGDPADLLDVYRPDAIVFDLGYEPPALLAALAGVAELRLPLVVLLPDGEYAMAAAAALAEIPAFGLLLRETDPSALAAALNGVAAGVVALDPALVTVLFPAGVSDLLLPPSDQLTPRELDVLRLLAHGLTNKAIAQELEISPNTVKFHLNAILAKLNAQSRTDAVVRATRLGLITL
jgi:DNA-binding NarL/FixJ family response regulator